MGIGPISEIFGSLTARLLALLTLALMPLGAIAVYQTSELSTQLGERAATALIAKSETAVADYSRLFQRAYGAAEAVAALTLPTVNTADACDAEISRMVALTDHVADAGLVSPSGERLCGTLDFVSATGVENFVPLLSNGKPFASALDTGAANEILIAHPVRKNGDLNHFVILSVSPATVAQTGTASDREGGPEGLIVFSRDGNVFASNFDATVFEQLDELGGIEAMASRAGEVLHLETNDDGLKVFAVVPVFRDLVYGLAEWDGHELNLLEGQTVISPWLLPLAMWLATLAVAYVAISRLVVRHARVLGDRMQRFADKRALPEIDKDGDQPEMFRTMNKTFLTMAEAVVEDEARLEDAVREKTMLIREVHHRVKNNLQLIASIMNMQVRKDRGSEASDVIRRLQDRVLGLAAVHRRMYEAESISDIPVDELLNDITNQMLLVDSRLAARARVEFAPLTLGPDQSVPLALLAAEATANAAKYASAANGDTPEIAIHLKHLGSEIYELMIENSLSPNDPVERKSVTNGLGKQLMQGFVTQLDGSLEIVEQDDLYRISVTFPAKTVLAEAQPPQVLAAS